MGVFNQKFIVWRRIAQQIHPEKVTCISQAELRQIPQEGCKIEQRMVLNPMERWLERNQGRSRKVLQESNV